MDWKMQWAISRIVEKLSPKFYGSITLTFQGGVLQNLKTEETQKPDKGV